MIIYNQKLVQKISELRASLNTLVLLLDLTHPKVLALNREINHLIVKLYNANPSGPYFR